MTLRWDPQALRDIQEISTYIATHGSAAAANRVRQHLRARANRLCTRPLLGIATSNPDIRALAPTRYPYRIYYTLAGDSVVILHIRHSARRDPNLSDMR